MVGHLPLEAIAPAFRLLHRRRKPELPAWRARFGPPTDSRLKRVSAMLIILAVYAILP